MSVNIMKFDKFIRGTFRYAIGIVIALIVLLIVQEVEWSKHVASLFGSEKEQIVQEEEPVLKNDNTTDIAIEQVEAEPVEIVEQKLEKSLFLKKLVEKQENIKWDFSSYIFNSDKVGAKDNGTVVVSGKIYFKNSCHYMEKNELVRKSLARFANQIVNEERIYLSFARAIKPVELITLKAEYKKDLIHPRYLEDDLVSIYENYVSLNSELVDPLVKQYNKSLDYNDRACTITSDDIKLDLVASVIGGNGGIKWFN